LIKLESSPSGGPGGPVGRERGDGTDDGAAGWAV
jgi:hypothetical protein